MKKTAVIFPGQGAQVAGMGQEIYNQYPQVRKRFSQANSLLNEDIREICFNARLDKLRDTFYQQVAIFLVSSVCWDIFKDKFRVTPYFFAGLSLGEYTSLYAAGVLSFSDALFLVRKRAEFMQEAAMNNPSLMLAVLGLDKEDVKEKAGSLFFIANLNCPGQLVVSLAKDMLPQAIDFFRSKGAKRVVELEVSGGFHSPFMDQARSSLKSVIDSLVFNDPVVPIVSNVTARPCLDREEIKENLLKQLCGVVLWADSVEFMKGQGVGVFFELGPSSVLKGILRKIDRSLQVESLGRPEDFNSLSYGF